MNQVSAVEQDNSSLPVISTNGKNRFQANTPSRHLPVQRLTLICRIRIPLGVKFFFLTQILPLRLGMTRLVLVGDGYLAERWIVCQARRTSATVQACAMQPLGAKGGAPSKISPKVPRP